MLISDGNFEAVVVGRKPNSSDEWWIVRWHDDKTLQRETLKGMGGWRSVDLGNRELKRRLAEYMSRDISLNAGTAIDRLMRML